MANYKLTPGRRDKRGYMSVPHDIFVHVTSHAGWTQDLELYEPHTRIPYLEAIKYWMEENGACVIRSKSSSKFAALKDITQCATILPGNQIVSGFTGPFEDEDDEIVPN